MAKFTCGLRFKARQPVREIEDWLEKNCEGAWDVTLAKLDDSVPGIIVSHLEVLFEKPSDRDKFKENHKA